MRVEGSFSGTPTLNILPQNDDLFEGAFTYVYDGALVPATGYHAFWAVRPTTLTFTAPHVGSRTFDSSNTLLTLVFEDSALRRAWLGEDLGQFSVPDGNMDDFAVLFNWTRPGALIWYYVADEPALRTDLEITSSLSVNALQVPDTPSTLCLMSLGLIGILPFRRKRVRPGSE